MTCEYLREDLSAWLDGELDAARSSIVVTHLETCEPCRATRLAWAHQRSCLRDAAGHTPPPPAWERLASRLAERAGPDLGPPQAKDGARTPASPSRASAEIVGWGAPPVRASRRARRVVFGLAACTGAAAALLGVAILFAVRTGRTAPAPADTVSPDLVRQLLDGERTPDLSALGDVTPVSWDRFRHLRRDAHFAPMAPAALPGGYVFDEGWVIDSRLCRMVCARYMKEGRVVAVLQSESSGRPLCTLANPQCCLIAGLLCRRSRIDNVDVLQATRSGLALTVAAHAGETDIEAVMASFNRPARHDRTGPVTE